MQCQSKRYSSVFGLVLATVVVFALSASAATPIGPPVHPMLYVNCSLHPSSLHTLQEAVNAAGGGYTIEVCAGYFTENVNINDATMHGAPPFDTLDGLQIVGEEAVTLRCPHYGVGSGFDLHASGVTIQGIDIS